MRATVLNLHKWPDYKVFDDPEAFSNYVFASKFITKFLLYVNLPTNKFPNLSAAHTVYESTMFIAVIYFGNWS